MIGPMFLSVLLANAAAVPQATVQPAVTPAVEPAQEPIDQPWPPEGTLRLAPGLTAPILVKEAKPRYTADAMRARIEGIVEMQVVVLADGTVGPVRVVRSLDKELGLDAQAVRAVKEWTFKPGRKDGQPVNVLVNIEMTFKVRDGR